MRNELLSAVCVLAAILFSAATSLFVNVYAGIAVAAPSFVAFYLLRQRIGGDSSQNESDSAQFIGNLIDNYGGHAGTISLVRASLSPDFRFYSDMNEALSRYLTRATPNSHSPSC